MLESVSPNPVLRLRPVRSDATLPRAVDVAVIGGGIVGAAAAWHLARRNMSVALFEKGVIGGEQSGRNWGWCRNTLRDPAEIPLMRRSMQDWRDPGVFGALDTGFRTTGIMYLCGRNRNDEALYQNWLDSVRNLGLDSRMLSATDVQKLVSFAKAPSGAIYTASDGCAEPEKATAAIVQAAQKSGATIHTRCAVRAIETSGGRVSAIVTEQGMVRCQAVLLAAGVWSRLFAGNLGIDLPQIKVMGSVMYTAPMAGGPDVSVAGRRFGWRKREDGGYIVSQADATIMDIVPDCFRLFNDFRPAMAAGLRSLRLRLGRRFVEEAQLPKRWRSDEITPFERVRIAEPDPADWVLDDAARNLGAACPFFSNMKIMGRWGGLIDVMPDMLPVIGAMPQIPGLFMATGFSGHGFGIGPGAGRLAADMIAGDTPVVDPTAFRPDRFARLRAGSGN